jgi:hypothetical protein
MDEVCITTDYVRIGHGRGRSAVYVHSNTLTTATAAAAAAVVDDDAIIDVDADADTASATIGETRALPLQGLSVEDVALQHYKALGYSGVHSEWRIPQLLTGLLLHDVIWSTSSVPAASCTYCKAARLTFTAVTLQGDAPLDCVNGCPLSPAIPGNK